METLEERNLNRLRKGKMMLEMSELRKSHIMAFVLALFFGALGVHRFYLGQIRMGVALLVLTVLSSTMLFLANDFTDSSQVDMIVNLVMIYSCWLLAEIVLSPYFTSRVNRRIKALLMSKYGVEDYTA